MSDDLRKQIYDNLNQKETGELFDIWKTNNRVEWTEVAFDVIQGILQERLGRLPTQNEPIVEHAEDDSDNEFDSDESLAIFTNKDNAPIFYKPKEILWLEKWIYRAAIASIVATIVSSLLELPRMQRIILSYFMGNIEWNNTAWLIAIVVFTFAVMLQSIFLYFPLKALGSILKILMEMEFNSRVIKPKKRLTSRAG
jgi:hypothetical protein